MNVKKLMLLLIASTTLSLNAFKLINETQEPITLSGFVICLEDQSRLSFSNRIVLDANTIIHSERIVMDLFHQVISSLHPHQVVSQGFPRMKQIAAHSGSSNSLLFEHLDHVERIVFYKNEQGELQVRYRKSLL